MRRDPLIDIGKYGVLQMPEFIHKFGDAVHHLCPAGYHPSHIVYVVHQCFDWIFYRIKRGLRDYIGDACPAYDILNAVLGFLWGFNCLFPSRDVANYTVWYLRGCKPIKYWTREEWDERKRIRGL